MLHSGTDKDWDCIYCIAQGLHIKCNITESIKRIQSVVSSSKYVLLMFSDTKDSHVMKIWNMAAKIHVCVSNVN